MSFGFKCLLLTTSHCDKTWCVQVLLVLGVVVQLALYRLAAFNSENSLRFGKVDEIPSHEICHFQIRLKFSEFHLSHGTLDHMTVFQRQKRDKVVHQVLIDQTRMPQST